jgi:hypothetical protein
MLSRLFSNEKQSTTHYLGNWRRKFVGINFFDVGTIYIMYMRGVDFMEQQQPEYFLPIFYFLNLKGFLSLKNQFGKIWE